MSSPFEPLVPSVGVDSFSTRPFSAPDAKGGDLLTVLVHFGRHLDNLLPKTELISTGTSTTAVERLNTYVVASVEACAASLDIVQCRRSDDRKPDQLSASTSSYKEERVLYEQKYSPYAATRVVEDSISPVWNEMLAISLPTEWSDTLALKLELVERGASHQEDFLLAMCVLPLSKLECHLQQKRFALEFPSGDVRSTAEQMPAASIYVSIQTSMSSQVSDTYSLEQVQVTVESFTPIVVTGSEDEEMPLDCTSLAALITLEVEGDGFNPSVPPSVEKFQVIEDHFILLHDGKLVSDSSGLKRPAGLTPSSSSASGSSSGVYEWFYPFCFALSTQGNQAPPFSAVNIDLFNTSSFSNKLVGRGRLELSSFPVQAIQKDGLPLRHTVIPVSPVSGSVRIVGHISLRLRWWDTAAWSAFLSNIPARRVVCTNRWKCSPRLTLPWMGALLRGLSRYPVTSICDAGGVSGVLAELLSESSSNSENTKSSQRELLQHHQINCTEINALLRGQIAYLQTEGTAQRVQNQRLQNELDTRLSAIKSCGLEIVALRREARQKDEESQKLREQVDAAQRREQEQLAELLASTNTNGVHTIRPDHQAASQRFMLLASKYKELEQKYQNVKQQLVDEQRTTASYADLETRHAKLQEAHLIQAALVQRLQREKQHATALKKAVRMQEKVIRQFEQTVAQQSAEVPKHSPPLRLMPSTEHSDANSEDDDGSETRETLLQVRVQVLEQQLKTNARAAGAELSALRMRILELETAESRRTGK